MRLLAAVCGGLAFMLLPIGYSVPPWGQVIFGGLALVFAFIGGAAYTTGHFEEVRP